MPKGDKPFSEETAREIDEEINRIIGECYLSAKEVLNGKREELEQVVEILFEKEVMDGDELRVLLGKPPDSAEAGNGEVQEDEESAAPPSAEIPNAKDNPAEEDSV